MRHDSVVSDLQSRIQDMEVEIAGLSSRLQELKAKQAQYRQAVLKLQEGNDLFSSTGTFSVTVSPEEGKLPIKDAVMRVFTQNPDASLSPQMIERALSDLRQQGQLDSKAAKLVYAVHRAVRELCDEQLVVSDGKQGRSSMFRKA